MKAHEIKQLIEKNLKETTAIIEDEDGRHFTAVVISPFFAAKNRVEKQQLVYGVLRDKINDGSIHAISIKTFTPEEWQQQLKES